MTQPFDVRKSDKPFDQNHTLVAVIELSQTSWLVGGIVPGLKRSPLKKLKPEKEQLLKLLVRWRDEAVKAGHEIMRIAVAHQVGFTAQARPDHALEPKVEHVVQISSR
ncbi:MAG: hypothetical protein V3V07_01580 [candidate division NC10 bacterium]